MRKADLIDIVAAETGAPKDGAAAVLRALVLAIQNEIQRGGNVTIWGLGTFHACRRAPKVVENFEGERIQLPARRAVYFKPSPEFRSMVR